MEYWVYIGGGAGGEAVLSREFDAQSVGKDTGVYWAAVTSRYNIS